MSGIIEQLLERRGLSGEAREAFLDPSLRRLAAAAALPGIAQAVDVMLPFVRARRKIVVFGDYDCDGVCASVILVKALRRIGAVAEAFFPDRFTEGYGMTPASVARLLQEHPDAALVVTVDCGITSVEEVRTLKARGIAVVVTDHHLPSATLPVCDALIDPKIEAQREGAVRIEAGDLCGAGLAFFLSGALVDRAVAEGLYDGGKFGAPLLVLAGLATVVDIAPLLGQNRILAANALRTFSAAPVGLRELLLRAQRRPVDLSARDFGFLIGPRLNAAGRMASARTAYELLMADDREMARNFAQVVDACNARRKSVENQMADEASAGLPDPLPAAVAICLKEDDSAEFRRTGVCGIVASRLLERCQVPVAVAVDGHGSARAPDGYDIHAALTACAAHLERFGGHKSAAGFTVKEGCFEAFRAAFEAACAAQAGEGRPGEAFPAPELWLEPRDLTRELYGELKALAPFGEGNPEPLFGLRGVALADVRIMGDNGKHVAFAFGDSRLPRATWWGHGHLAEKLRAKAAERWDVAFTLDESDWGGGEPRLELRICGMALAHPGG